MIAFRLILCHNWDGIIWKALSKLVKTHFLEQFQILQKSKAKAYPVPEKIPQSLNYSKNMAEHSRYNVHEEEGREVLRNKLGIKDKKTIEDIETLLLSDSYTHYFGLLRLGKLIFTLDLVFDIHRYFLNILYRWAGTIRTVEISKGGILFCPHLHIKKELENFKQILKKNMPSPSESRRNISKKIAIIHCEFNAIHPFREGNGRTIRLFLDLLAAHFGFNIIDYGKSSKKSYIKACIAGMHKDYSKMQKILYKGLSSI